MEDHNDAPAFPVTAGNQVYATGMMLRDYLASQAPVTWGMACEGANQSVVTPQVRSKVWAVMATLRYEYADAMLEARK